MLLSSHKQMASVFQPQKLNLLVVQPKDGVKLLSIVLNHKPPTTIYSYRSNWHNSHVTVYLSTANPIMDAGIHYQS